MKLWWVLLVLSWALALYGLSFHVRGNAAFPEALAESLAAHPWGIYSHVLFGALALMAGALQFRRDILARRRALHRNIGRVYVVSAIMTGAVGLYMARYSHGGMVTHLAFGLLSLVTIFTTGMAYVRIRAFDVAAHREWMIRSLALIFAAVTLRIELPILVAAHLGAFTPAYQIVSWLCWVPNLIWAEWYVRRTRGGAGASELPRHSGAAGFRRGTDRDDLQLPHRAG
jgi:uncharacterized membrane protein